MKLLMGKTARQFNKMYMNYKKRFKKPIASIVPIIPTDFSDNFFIETFKRLYPYMWDDLEKQYTYWHEKNNFLINHGKKSRYNFRKPYNFILDCSFYVRKELRKNASRPILTIKEQEKIENDIFAHSTAKVKEQQEKVYEKLYYVQEVEPTYTKAFIDQYFKTHDLHERLEIIRELSKYESDQIIEFFYKVNICTRNFSLKEESMKYIQRLDLPFVLHRKKKGKTNYIDNEIVKNESNPEILMQRLYVDKLERLKVFDVFISHNSKNESEIVNFFKLLNQKGYVAYIDWVNDKFDLKRQWCNATTAEIIKARIKQSRVFVLYLSEQTLTSQWCPWEVGYADALGKKICIYQPTKDIAYVPQFYLAYPRLIFDSQAIINIDGEKISFDEWIQR